jgi:hypothetical protein
VDYGSPGGSGYGKWIADNDIKFSFNQAISGSLTGPPCS